MERIPILSLEETLLLLRNPKSMITLPIQLLLGTPQELLSALKTLRPMLKKLKDPIPLLDSLSSIILRNIFPQTDVLVLILTLILDLLSQY